MCHIEVEALGAIVLASTERDSKAYLAQGDRGPVGDASEWPRRCQPLVGDLQLLECLDGDHVEARTPIKEFLGDGDVVDGGGADEGDGADSPCGLGVVAGVEGDLVLGPLEWLGRFDSREGSVELLRDPLEIAVREGGLCPA